MSENEGELKDKVVDELKGYFDSKFEDLQRNFKEDSEWTAENVRKKVRTDSAVSFRSVANKKQFIFNAGICDILDNASRAISLRNADKAEEFLEEALRKLKHRNKLIRIADSSPAGWLTIQEYEQNEVASDAEDDKRIRRAEDRAKARMEKSKRSETPSNPFRSTPPVNSSESFRSRFRKAERFGAGQQLRREVVCYECGGTGHFANGCAAFLQQNRARPMGQGTGEGKDARIDDKTEQPGMATKQ